MPLKDPPPMKTFCVRHWQCAFLFDDSTTLLTLCCLNKSSKKLVTLLSSMHTQADIHEKGKPEIIMYYNKTKGVVDTFDQDSPINSCSRMTRRWTLVIFYVMGWWIPRELMLQSCTTATRSIKKKTKGSEVHETTCTWDDTAMGGDKACSVNTSVGVREAVKMTFPQLAIVSTLPGPVHLPKQKRCKIWPYSRDRKTKQMCTVCHQPLCKDHAKLVLICTDCYPAGKTSCKLSFTAWYLCSFIYVNCKQPCLVCWEELTSIFVVFYSQ